MNDVRYRTCCFAGSAVLPFPDDEIRERVREYVRLLVRAGIVNYLTGGGPGFDRMVMEVLWELRLNEKLPIRIMTVWPFPRDPETASEAYQVHMNWVRNGSDRIAYTSQRPYPGVRRDRDRRMINRCEYCICFCDSPRSEEADTIRYALEQGRWVRNTADWDLALLGSGA